MRARPAHEHVARPLWRLLACAAAIAMAPACAETVTLRASTLEGPRLPLRALPGVVIVHGKADRALARSLSSHLAALGHTRAVVVSESALREEGRVPPMKRSFGLVQLRREAVARRHHAHGLGEQTVCDSLGCFSVSAGSGFDTPALESVVSVTVRSGPSLRLRDRAIVRSLVLGTDEAELRARSHSQLATRLRTLIDVQRRKRPYTLFLVGGAAAGVDLAEDGEYRAAALHFEAEAARPEWSAVTREHLRYNAAVCYGFVDEGLDLNALRRGLELLDVPRDSRSGRLFRSARITLLAQYRAAQNLHAQRRAAHRNFLGAAPAANKGTQADGASITRPP